MDVKSLYVVGLVACYSGKKGKSARYESGKRLKETKRQPSGARRVAAATNRQKD